MKINPKELVERIISRQIYQNSLSSEQKIEQYKESIRFEIEMYNKHRKHLNNRFDLKCMRFNIATIISNIESIKKKGDKKAC
jgi:hypothetical protein